MECVYVNRDPQWALYHIRKQGGKGRFIDSLKEAEPPTPWEEPITYVMASTPSSLPPWGRLWVSGQKDTLGNYPDYGKEILKECLGILDRELCRWLLSKYEQYPGALERLTLKLKILAMRKRDVLTMGDVLPLIPTVNSTPFLWSYQKAIGKPEGLALIYGASNTDLWKTYMIDVGLMKYLKASYPHLVHSLSTMRANVNRGIPIQDCAILWHLNSMSATTPITI